MTMFREGTLTLRPSVVACAEDTPLDRHAAFRHIEELIAVLFLARSARLPPAVGESFPRPPVLAVGVAVKSLVISMP
jgi:hypothetical protein